MNPGCSAKGPYDSWRCACEACLAKERAWRESLEAERRATNEEYRVRELPPVDYAHVELLVERVRRERGGRL